MTFAIVCLTKVTAPVAALAFLSVLADGRWLQTGAMLPSLLAVVTLTWRYRLAASVVGGKARVEGRE